MSRPCRIRHVRTRGIQRRHWKDKGDNVTKYFYDCEFLEDGSTINLVSIGIVCDDGRQYYAVNSEADWKRIEKDDWLMTNVIPHLPLRPGKKPYKFENRSWIWGLDMSSPLIKPKWVIANEVREFLLTEAGNGSEKHLMPELWAYYGAYDHVALARLWGKMINLPKGIPMWTHDLMTLIEAHPNTKLPAHVGEHDALADARWNMAAHEWLTANS